MKTHAGREEYAIQEREAAIEKRIAEAVAAEREHCAQIADLKAVNTGRGVCDEIAAAIRARGGAEIGSRPLRVVPAQKAP